MFASIHSVLFGVRVIEPLVPTFHVNGIVFGIVRPLDGRGTRQNIAEKMLPVCQQVRVDAVQTHASDDCVAGARTDRFPVIRQRNYCLEPHLVPHFGAHFAAHLLAPQPASFICFLCEHLPAHFDISDFGSPFAVPFISSAAAGSAKVAAVKAASEASLKEVFMCSP